MVRSGVFDKNEIDICEFMVLLILLLTMNQDQNLKQKLTKCLPFWCCKEMRHEPIKRNDTSEVQFL